jgi:hypothetical protein
LSKVLINSVLPVLAESEANTFSFSRNMLGGLSDAGKSYNLDQHVDQMITRALLSLLVCFKALLCTSDLDALKERGSI